MVPSSPLACATCGAPLPADAAFCPACGAAVATTTRAGEERRLVTIVFADVTGSTELGERLDPERFREVMQAYAQAMREEIEAEGGTVEKFIGDAVMAAFGVPTAHEDDPARALRAGRRMLDTIACGQRGSAHAQTASSCRSGSGSTPARCSRRSIRRRAKRWSPAMP